MFGEFKLNLPDSKLQKPPGYIQVALFKEDFKNVNESCQGMDQRICYLYKWT